MFALKFRSMEKSLLCLLHTIDFGLSNCMKYYDKHRFKIKKTV